MRVYTSREAIQDEIKNWLETYSKYARDMPMAWTKGTPLGHFVDRVEALDPKTCTREEMGAAVGKDGSWGANSCDECGKDSPALIRFGDEPDYEARWQDLCADCLGLAADSLATTPTRNTSQIGEG
jgi:hypothetical protein